MGNNCPLQKAQPLGAKLNGKIRISATNGSAMVILLGWGRENPEERNDEIDAQIRLEVVVRLTPASRPDCLDVHRYDRVLSTINCHAGILRGQVARRLSCVAGVLR